MALHTLLITLNEKFCQNDNNLLYITISNGGEKKTRFCPGSKYDYQVTAFIMLPLRYGSVLANIILITVLRLSVDLSSQ